MGRDMVMLDSRKLPEEFEERMQMMLNCALCDVNYAAVNRQNFDYFALKALLANDLYLAELNQKIADNCRATLAFYAKVGLFPDTAETA